MQILNTENHCKVTCLLIEGIDISSWYLFDDGRELPHGHPCTHKCSLYCYVRRYTVHLDFWKYRHDCPVSRLKQSDSIVNNSVEANLVYILKYRSLQSRPSTATWQCLAQGMQSYDDVFYNYMHYNTISFMLSLMVMLCGCFFIKRKIYIPSSLEYKTHFSSQLNCWSLRCSWSIACPTTSSFST